MTQPCGPSTRTPPPRDELLGALRSEGARHDAAIGELHATLLRAARFEIARRATALAHVRGEDREDLALQAADDAFVAVMEKLHEFRGESRFTTWVYKFALYEAALRVRRRAWQEREVVLEPDSWLSLGDHAAEPAARYDRAELLGAIRALIDSALSARQREVLIALTIQGIPIDVLADRLGTTRGALYKSLHDARRKLRAELAAAGYDLESVCP